jgi:hypothetical protein
MANTWTNHMHNPKPAASGFTTPVVLRTNVFTNARLGGAVVNNGINWIYGGRLVYPLAEWPSTPVPISDGPLAGGVQLPAVRATSTGTAHGLSLNGPPLPAATIVTYSAYVRVPVARYMTWRILAALLNYRSMQWVPAGVWTRVAVNWALSAGSPWVFLAATQPPPSTDNGVFGPGETFDVAGFMVEADNPALGWQAGQPEVPHVLLPTETGYEAGTDVIWASIPEYFDGGIPGAGGITNSWATGDPATSTSVQCAMAAGTPSDHAPEWDGGANLVYWVADGPGPGGAAQMSWPGTGVVQTPVVRQWALPPGAPWVGFAVDVAPDYQGIGDVFRLTAMTMAGGASVDSASTDVSIPAGVWSRVAVACPLSAGAQHLNVLTSQWQGFTAVRGPQYRLRGAVLATGATQGEVLAQVAASWDGDSAGDLSRFFAWTGPPDDSASISGATMNATIQPAPLTRVLVEVFVPGVFSVYRVPVDPAGAPSGPPVPVRGFTAAACPTSRVDTEAPLRGSFRYIATPPTDPGQVLAQSLVVTTTASLPEISDPLTGAGIRATIVDWVTLTAPARQSVLDIPGARYPLVIADVRGAPGSQLVALTRTRGDLEALRAVLATGNTILVRGTCEGIEDTFAHAGDISETRVNPASGPGAVRPAGGDWRRLVTIALQHTGQPWPGIPAWGDTLAGLHAWATTGGTTTLGAVDARLTQSAGGQATLTDLAATYVGRGGL